MRIETETAVSSVVIVIVMKVRGHWKSSRFFYGKNRVIQAALGRTEEGEYKEGLSRLAKVCLCQCVNFAVIWRSSSCLRLTLGLGCALYMYVMYMYVILFFCFRHQLGVLSCKQARE